MSTPGYTAGFVDTEWAIATHLAAVLTPIRVVTELPAHVEDALPVVRVAGAGGPDDRLTARERIDVECFAATRADARDLAERARIAMHATSHTVVGGWLIDRVSTEAGPFWADYANDAVRRYVATYLVESRIRR